jgi:hypothetical protein
MRDPLEATHGCGPTRGVDRRSTARLLLDKAGLELSSASISALLTKQPSRVKLETLAALGFGILHDPPPRGRSAEASSLPPVTVASGAA